MGQPAAIPGKMIFHDRPTPRDEDRIYLLRKDSRKSDYKFPAQGDAYKGPNAKQFEGFFFVDWRATDQVGWIDEIYLNERANQDDYNGEITYPYVDKNYPMITRTYVVLRGDQRADEPTADTNDPVYSDLKLSDHKIYRVNSGEYQFLDNMFVGIQRVYERLPGPVIRTYETNQFQQVVNVDTQTVQTESVPTPNATVEIDKTARVGTAKAQVTLGTVDAVFSNIDYKLGGEDPINPYRFRKFAIAQPALVTTQMLAGTAAPPTLGSGDFAAEQHQTTKY